MRELITVPELSRRLKCSPWTIFSWVSQKLLPKYPGLGRMVRFDPEELDEWLRKGGIEAARKEKTRACQGKGGE